MCTLNVSLRFLLPFLLLVASCTKMLTPLPMEEPPLLPPLYREEVTLLPPSQTLELVQALDPAFQHLNSWKDFTFAIDQSLAFVQTQPATRTAIKLGDRKVSYNDLAQSLITIKEILPYLDDNPKLLSSRFDWYRIAPDFGFTGYYEPELLASNVPTEHFRYPLYKMPNMRRKPTRHEIDRKGALSGKGLEIAWVADPVELFILQIQGSGRLRYPDGTVRYALYSGQNGHRYVSLGRIMKERGYLNPDDVDMDSIRRWIAGHPDQRDELLDTNPSYVFFRLADSPSKGSMGREITSWISVASDIRVLPSGSLTFMSVKIPKEDGKHWFHALTLPQDRGGAIQGHRIDIFCGHGACSQYVASHLDARGAVVMLLPKKTSLRKTR